MLDFEYVSLSCWILKRSEREDLFKIQQDGGSASAEVDRKIPGRRRVERRTHTSQTRATQDRTQRGGRGKRERDWRREKKKRKITTTELLYVRVKKIKRVCGERTARGKREGTSGHEAVTEQRAEEGVKRERSGCGEKERRRGRRRSWSRVHTD